MKKRLLPIILIFCVLVVMVAIYIVFITNGKNVVKHDETNKTQEITISENNIVPVDFDITEGLDLNISYPDTISRGETFEFIINIQNKLNSKIDAIDMEITTPSAVKLLSDLDSTIGGLDEGEEKSYILKALAVYGGREVIGIKVSRHDSFITEDFALDISGFGWYGGDNHSHSTNSDGVNTIAQNVESTHKNKNLSWLICTDHNTNTQDADVETETAKMAGNFVAISGVEITTNPNDNKGHALAFAYESMPTVSITEKGGTFDWQASINEVIDVGGLFYMAHPFHTKYGFKDKDIWHDFTGIEVWNGTWHAFYSSNRRAFNFWDEINVRGEKRYYGIAGSDGHNIDAIGSLYTRGPLDSLTADNVINLLKTGQYYGTNGPDLRFDINGVGMGNTLTIEQAGDVTINIEAFSKHGNLTNIKVLGYPVTGNIDGYYAGEVVFEKNLTGMDTNFYFTDVPINVDRNMFFRLEVRSDRFAPGSVITGAETGTGFAYSNPIWVDIGSEDTSLDIRNITYNGVVGIAAEADGFGRKVLNVDTKNFDVNALEIDSNGAVTKAFKPVNHEESDVIGLLDINVSASESVKTTYSFVVCYTS
jgi:hypothetical protein